MKIAVIGTGYVGLVTGACFSAKGNTVCCIDKDERKIGMLREGRMPIYEDGLTEMVLENAGAKRLLFTTSLADGVRDAELVFIAVGTPQSASGAADLTGVWAVADALAPLLNERQIVVVKSTVPVGTNAALAERLERERGGNAVEVASNPEFLKEGVAINDCMNPDRVVVGVRSEAVREKLRALYAPFLKSEKQFLSMSPESAEMTKYAANAMLAMRISFINEIANLCERLGADVTEVRDGVGSDSRIGRQFLLPGPGYGGSCFPKDVSALIYLFEQAGLASYLLDATERANLAQKQMLPRKIHGHFGDDLLGRTIAVWGLAFKPNTDDVREAPAIDLIQNLLNADVKLRVHDPKAADNIREIFKDKLTYCADPREAARGADALVIVTEWDDYRKVPLAELKSLLAGHVIFDGRNLYQPAEVAKAGFTYYPVGRGGK